MEVTETRIYKLRTYLLTILDELTSNEQYQLNANFLAENVDNYSLDKVPVEDKSEDWIIPIKIYKDVYELRSRQTYSVDVMDNLSSIGFFENFERIIEEKNKNRDLPEIDGIQEIKCLNCGALSEAESQTAEFSVQIQISYMKGVGK